MLDLLQEIAQVDEVEIQEILRAVQRRYGQLFPDWELSVITLQKSADPKVQLDRIIELLQKIKTTYR